MELPNEFKEKYIELLGEKDSKKFFEAIDGKNIKGFKLNPLKNNYKNVEYSLDKPVSFAKDGYYGEINGNDIDWISGYVYSQDPSAMLPAQVADIQPGEKVLDLCAAPGGKSTTLADKLDDQGVLVANEISSKRVKDLRENLEKWGASNVLITNSSSEKLTPAFKGFFDKILVDAPCSGEGMFRKNPDAMKYWSQDYVLECQDRQKDILNEAVAMLKPGGQLIYSTCTYSPEEDEEIVEWLHNNYNLEILPLKQIEGLTPGNPKWTQNNLEDVKNTGRFWFQDGVGEGQFISLLQKPNLENDQYERPKRKKNKKKKLKNSIEHLNKEQVKLIYKVLSKFELPDNLENWKKDSLISNDHVFIPVIDPTVLKDVHTINNGVELGLMKKNRFEPGHQLAEVLDQLPQKNKIELEDSEVFRKYLHGETIKVKTDLRGFVLVAFKDKVFSFGKIGNDQVLKNYYPKGLRK